MIYGWDSTTVVGFDENRSGVSDTLYFLPEVYIINQGRYDDNSWDTLYCYNEKADFPDSEYLAWIGERDYGPGKLRPVIKVPVSLLSEVQGGWNINGE